MGRQMIKDLSREPCPTQARLLCTADAADGWTWFRDEMPEAGLSWAFVLPGRRSGFEKLLHKPNLTNIRLGFKTARAAQRTPPHLMVAHLPRVAFWVGLMKRAFGIQVPLLAYAFNFTRLPHQIMPRPVSRLIYSFAFRGVDRFVVFSNFEADLYSRYFHIPRDRFDVLLWGMDTPKFAPAAPIIDGHYVCSVGGNARDYKTLLEAATRLPHMKFVLVVRRDSLAGLTVPGNVEVLVDIPYGRAMNILNFSRFMVLPLEGAEVPCGHVTMVSCMHLGRALIVTESVGIVDYAHDNETAVVVPFGDASRLTEAIERLWQDPELSERLGANAKIFAREHCSPDHHKSHLHSYLKRLGAPVRPTWEKSVQSCTQRG